MNAYALSPENMATLPTGDLVLLSNAGSVQHADVVIALAGALAAEELARRGVLA